jgi:hypothetical protein
LFIFRSQVLPIKRETQRNPCDETDDDVSRDAGFPGWGND